jgi:hypothetical protein
MPTPRANFAIAAYNGKIYCMGGEVLDKPGDYKIYRVVEVYDTVADSWSTKTEIPFDGLGFQVYVVGGKIFALSGCDLFMYDPVTDKWTQKTSMPSPDDIAVNAVLFTVFSVIMDDKITVCFKYVPNDVDLDFLPYFPPSFEFKGKVMIYDAQTNVWSEGKSPPNVQPRVMVSCCMTTGVYAPKKIYVIGLGDGAGQPTLSNWVYDPVKNTWSTVENTPYRVQFGMVVVDDILYVIGGKDAFDYVLFSDTEQYIPVGYKGTIPVSEPSNSDTSEPSILLNIPYVYIAVAALVLIVSVVVTGSVFYFKKKESCSLKIKNKIS